MSSPVMSEAGIIIPGSFGVYHNPLVSQSMMLLCLQ